MRDLSEQELGQVYGAGYYPPPKKHKDHDKKKCYPDDHKKKKCYDDHKKKCYDDHKKKVY